MKKILIIMFSFLFTFTFFFKVNANDVKIIDDENVLSEQEKQELNKLIDDYINHTGYDMVVYLANKGNSFYEEEGHTITDLADDTFDYNGYGIGDDNEGIILCFDIMYRYYTITTSGPSCIDTYSIAALDSVYENVDPYYMENDFFGGTKAFIRYAKAAYDNYDLYHEKHNRVLEAATPALIISAIITIISFLVMSSKLKSQRVSVTAGQYMKNNNINILRSGDIYLYSNVSRTKIERMENHMSNSHSSPTHISSSGHTHGGGGSHRV